MSRYVLSGSPLGLVRARVTETPGVRHPIARLCSTGIAAGSQDMRYRHDRELRDQLMKGPGDGAREPWARARDVVSWLVELDVSGYVGGKAELVAVA